MSHIKKLSETLDQWVQATGAVPRGGSWQLEIQGMLEDAFNAGLAERSSQVGIDLSAGDDHSVVSHWDGKSIDAIFQPNSVSQTLKQAIAVAITQLYPTDSADVLKTFSIDELRSVSEISESLRPRQVEDIYREAWDLLNAAQVTEARKAAMLIYKPPFKFNRGYIHDSAGHMVADDDQVQGSIAAQVRGWGYINGRFQEPETLQDEIGQMMADALNAYYGHPIQTKEGGAT
jgi:hypothetical protein